MTHPSEDSAIRAAMESLIDNGLDGLGEALRILMNEAMKIERTDFLQAGPYERSEDRVGHANGFKDKTVAHPLWRCYAPGAPGAGGTRWPGGFLPAK